MPKTKVGNWFETIDHKRADRYYDYWLDLAPWTPREMFQSWLFAFMSVKTTWQLNVRGYNALKDLTWLQSKSALHSAIRNSGAGFHNQRTEYIWDFTQKFWSDPQAFKKFRNQSWRSYRNQMVEQVKGLSYAKTTFAIELMYPDAPVCCLDRHIIRFMTGDIKLNGNISEETYTKLEARWVRAAKKNGVLPVMARHIYWDDLQGHNNTQYWSHVFEDTHGLEVR